MVYLLDSNIFITAKNSLPTDIYLSFWRTIAGLAHSGHFKSVKKVETELRKGKDELVTWIDTDLPQDFFIQEDINTLTALAKVSAWANQSTTYSPAAKTEFATVADSWIVAEALSRSLTVVTFETSDINCKRRVKIPDACNAVGVNFCTLNDAFRALGVTI